MTFHTVRIELHGTDDYDPLHKEMEKRGFKRTIIGRKATYHLPPGEYNEISSRVAGEVIVDAAAAIRAVGQRGAVLVTPSEAGRSWRLLDEVHDEDED